MDFSVSKWCLVLLFVLRTDARYIRPQPLIARNIADEIAAGISFSKNDSTTDSGTTESEQCWTSWTSFWESYTPNATTSTSLLGQSVLTTTGTVDQSSYTVTATSSNYSTTTYTLIPTLTPVCKLPSSVSQCQASWETWASIEVFPSPTATNNCTVILPPYPACATLVDSAASSWLDAVSTPSPSCSQASIGGDLCQSLRDAYVTGTNQQLLPSDLGYDALFSNGYIGQITAVTKPDGTGLTTSSAYTWPTSRSLAPSCTLGCARCAVTGGTVRLLYWPTTSHSGTETGVATIRTLGTTLTSPTNYISFRTMYASDACKGVGGTYYSTVLPIPTASTLSSQWGAPYPYDAHLFQQVAQVYIGTTSFNYADLHSPVPESIYSSQPWCASFTVSQWASGNVANVTCPMTRSYEPILVVPRAVFNSVDPAWATCSLDVRGLYDPPIALSVMASLAVPTITAAGSTTAIAAIPASSLQQVTASATFTTLSTSAAQEQSASPSDASSVVYVPETSVSSQAVSAGEISSADISNTANTQVSSAAPANSDTNVSGTMTSDTEQAQSAATSEAGLIYSYPDTQPQSSQGAAGTATDGASPATTNALSILSAALATIFASEPLSAATISSSLNAETNANPQETIIGTTSSNSDAVVILTSEVLETATRTLSIFQDSSAGSTAIASSTGGASPGGTSTSTTSSTASFPASRGTGTADTAAGSGSTSSEYSVPTPITAQTSLPAIVTETLQVSSSTTTGSLQALSSVVGPSSTSSRSGNAGMRRLGSVDGGFVAAFGIVVGVLV